MSSGKDRLFEIINTIRKYDLIKNMSAERLRLAIEELGPTFIKLGQILSYRDDVIPKEYCEELSHLRNQVKPMEFEKVMEIFREYLEQESCIEIVKTRWGYVRLFYEEPYDSGFEAALCRTPKELFSELLENLLASHEYRLATEEGKTEKEVMKELEQIRERYIEKWKKKQ